MTIASIATRDAIEVHMPAEIRRPPDDPRSAASISCVGFRVSENHAQARTGKDIPPRDLKNDPSACQGFSQQILPAHEEPSKTRPAPSTGRTGQSFCAGVGGKHLLLRKERRKAANRFDHDKRVINSRAEIGPFQASRRGFLSGVKSVDYHRFCTVSSGNSLGPSKIGSGHKHTALREL